MIMIDIYNAPQKSVMVMCHTSMGDPNDKHGRYFEAGEEYRMGTEIIKPSADTNYQKCILCWIDFNAGFGTRFAVKGNVYDSFGKAYWSDFKDYFICPVAKVRDEQLEKLGL
jgi:rubredoxin